MGTYEVNHGMCNLCGVLDGWNERFLASSNKFEICFENCTSHGVRKSCYSPLFKADFSMFWFFVRRMYYLILGEHNDFCIITWKILMAINTFHIIQSHHTVETKIWPFSNIYNSINLNLNNSFLNIHCWFSSFQFELLGYTSISMMHCLTVVMHVSCSRWGWGRFVQC